MPDVDVASQILFGPENLEAAPVRSSDALAYPRPQLVRSAFHRLDGPWGYATDDGDEGRAGGWSSVQAPFDRTITVPFPPESTMSGVADRGFHPVVWYRRDLTADDLAAAGALPGDGRILLHFGAVDYAADVWLGGHHLGRHEGGHTPFSFDITDHVVGNEGGATLVVRAEDDPRDVGQPRGKQDWMPEPHGIWYERTTGIWQPVWLEAVPAVHVSALTWTSDTRARTVSLDVELGGRPAHPVDVRVTLSFEGEQLASMRYSTAEPRSTAVIPLSNRTTRHTMQPLLWSPETPRLIDAEVTVLGPSGHDSVRSYFGMRSVGWADGHFLLNERPYYVRGVLAQNYWPESHLAAPSDDAIRDEVQLAKDLGFNTIRVHQKLEDPRFLAWADRLGVLVWAEAPSAYEFSPAAVSRLTTEWLAVLRRDASHPSIVAWVPFNESWGVQQIARAPEQLAFVQGLSLLTRAMDPSRLVVTNDGWEHGDSDLVTVHDYGVTRGEVEPNYSDRAAVDGMLGGVGPLGRRIRLVDGPVADRPVLVSEFGGISFASDHDDDPDGWGYETVQTAADFEELVRDLFEALQSSPVLAGWCYTQLTDTGQEMNGLVDAARRPKLPVETIRAIVEGVGVDTGSHRRPKEPVERPLTASGPTEDGSRSNHPQTHAGS